MRIDRDRLSNPAKSLNKPLFRYRIEGCKRAQIEVVGGEIIGWAIGRTATLGSLQSRLDNAGNAGRYLVLEGENIFERAVETVGPKVGAGLGID